MIKKLSKALTLLIGLVGITHTYLANAGKGPNMAAFAEDKKVVVIDQQYTSRANDPTGHYTNTFLYSVDYGKTWRYSHYPVAENTYNFCGPETWGHNVFAIKYLGQKGKKTFISTGSAGVICTSNDGRAWSMAHPSSSVGDRDPTNTVEPIYDVAFDGKNTFVAVGGGGVAMYSTKPNSKWRRVRYSFDRYSLNSVVFGQGKFVAVANDSNIWYSIDGRRWTQSKGLYGHADFQKVIYEPTANNGSGQFVAVGSNATIWYSSSGKEWSIAKLSNDSSETFFTDVVYGKGQFVAIGNDNTVARSADGINWIADTSALYRAEGGVYILNHPHAIIYAYNKYIAVTANFDPLIQDGFIFTSADAVTWNLAPIFGKDNETAVSVNYLATVINTDRGLLAIPYGSGDALANAPAYILYSSDGSSTGLRWKALCELGFDCEVHD